MQENEIQELIENYPRQYPTPKYLLFMLEMSKCGFEVSLHKSKSTVSKYIYLRKGDKQYKVRFSNHRSNFRHELEADCDFYVGVGNMGVKTTETVIKEIKNLENTLSDFGYLLKQAMQLTKKGKNETKNS